MELESATTVFDAEEIPSLSGEESAQDEHRERDAMFEREKRFASLLPPTSKECQPKVDGFSK